MRATVAGASAAHLRSSAAAVVRLLHVAGTRSECGPSAESGEGCGGEDGLDLWLPHPTVIRSWLHTVQKFPLRRVAQLMAKAEGSPDEKRRYQP